MFKVLIILVMAAAVLVTAWAYSSYFKFEAKSYETSTSALEKAQDTKVMLEARDKALQVKMQQEAY